MVHWRIKAHKLQPTVENISIKKVLGHVSVLKMGSYPTLGCVNRGRGQRAAWGRFLGEVSGN